jgi:hypothetical protein
MHDRDRVGPEQTQVALHRRAKLLGCVRGHEATAGVVLPAELGRNHEVLRIGARRLCEQLVRDVGTVVPGRVEYPDPELERPPKHTSSLIGVRRRPEHAGTRQAHRSIADTGHACADQFEKTAARNGRAGIHTDVFNHMLEKVASGGAAGPGVEPGGKLM